MLLRFLLTVLLSATFLCAETPPAPAPKPPLLASALQHAIDTDGLDAAQKSWDAGKGAAYANLDQNENALNNLGYSYLGKNQTPAALFILQTNAQLHPDSWNDYDSLGEAFAFSGDQAQSTANFEKSLSLNPKNRNATSFLAEFKASPDALKTMQARFHFADAMRAAVRAQAKGEAIDLPPLRTQLHAVTDPNPLADLSGQLISAFLDLSENTDLQGAVQDWKAFAASSNPDIKSAAEAKLKLADLLPHPVEMKFMAIDGRDVDLAQLRGKVVLIDFWATWCGPCKKEIPNVVANYEKFHAAGFEVIGISFDKSPTSGKPNKLEKSADDVFAFTKEHSMPWPQFYDGLYWDNAFGKQYGIRGIPAMFLLDQNGLIVSTNARGPKLERELQRLLHP